MLTKIGILGVLAGFIVGVFSGISKFMESKNFWVDITLSKVIGETATQKITGITEAGIFHDALHYLLLDLSFSFFLAGLGLILLVISLFFKNY